jgi:nicotinate-nucleotide pyrophosphorylase (carboxylating)
MDSKESVEKIVELALLEDLGEGDITAQATVPEKTRAVGIIRAKETCVLSGTRAAKLVFERVDSRISYVAKTEDGSSLSTGDEIAEISGPARSILSAERVALNFVMHLSGVATLTRAFVEKAGEFGVDILDTRKTMPGLRHLEKEAVLHGGGKNHRMGLWDEFLVKNNHIAAAGGVKQAVAGAAGMKQGRKLVVEVRDMRELEDALSVGSVDRVLLDNMSPDEMKEAIARIRTGTEDAKVEISGGVTLEKIEELARLRPDFISIGAITHSAASVNMSMSLRLESS